MKAAQIGKPGEILIDRTRHSRAGRRTGFRVKVDACGICHSDVLVNRRSVAGLQYPRVPGHENRGARPMPAFAARLPTRLAFAFVLATRASTRPAISCLAHVDIEVPARTDRLLTGHAVADATRVHFHADLPAPGSGMSRRSTQNLRRVCRSVQLSIFVFILRVQYRPVPKLTPVLGQFLNRLIKSEYDRLGTNGCP